MSEFRAAVDLADIEAMDSDEMVSGYLAGMAGAPEPLASTFSRAYVHGWRNGRVDGGHAETDPAQQHVARQYTEAQRSVH